MSLSSISSVSGSGDAAWQSPLQQAAEDLGALGKALQSGSLSGAQSAFVALQKDLTPAGSSATGAGAASPLAPLGQALQSGNLSAAQTAFAALQKGSKGHHHHHHGGASASPPPVSPSTSSTGATSVAGSPVGSVLNASA